MGRIVEKEESDSIENNNNNMHRLLFSTRVKTTPVGNNKVESPDKLQLLPPPPDNFFTPPVAKNHAKNLVSDPQTPSRTPLKKFSFLMKNKKNGQITKIPKMS